MGHPRPAHDMLLKSYTDLSEEQRESCARDLE